LIVTGQQRAIATFLEAVARGRSWHVVLREEAIRLPTQEALLLARVLDANRLTRLAFETLTPLDGSSIRTLKAELKTKVRMMDEALKSRDEVLRALSMTFSQSDIDYAVFKTLNGFGSIGVDVDVMINLSDFSPCLEALQSQGFRLIDDPSKRYATGLVFGANPIILDLHTDLAVLGVRYAPPELLLRDARETHYTPSNSHEGFPLRVAPEHAEALTRIAHAIVKEGNVTLLDVAEVLRQTADGASDIGASAKEVGLELAVSAFSWVALHAVRLPSLSQWLDIRDTALHSMVKGVLARMDGEVTFPERMPLPVVLAALVDRLIETGELRTAFRAFKALPFKRNIEQLRSRVIERIASQV